jgi:hypothetical protein
MRALLAQAKKMLLLQHRVHESVSVAHHAVHHCATASYLLLFVAAVLSLWTVLPTLASGTPRSLRQGAAQELLC